MKSLKKGNKMSTWVRPLSSRAGTVALHLLYSTPGELLTNTHAWAQPPEMLI